MKDVMVVVLTVAFFALAVGYVGLCDRIIGEDLGPGPTGGAAATEHPATDHPATGHPAGDYPAGDHATDDDRVEA